MGGIMQDLSKEQMRSDIPDFQPGDTLRVNVRVREGDKERLQAFEGMCIARKGGGPSLIEAATYRHGGHSRADPGKYRPDEEVKAWLAKDPVPRYRARLLELGIPASDIEKIEAETNAEIDRATETARNAPPPPLELADKDVWADGGSAWRN